MHPPLCLLFRFSRRHIQHHRPNLLIVVISRIVGHPLQQAADVKREQQMVVVEKAQRR